jgi:hypothetical protein
MMSAGSKQRRCTLAHSWDELRGVRLPAWLCAARVGVLRLGRVGAVIYCTSADLIGKLFPEFLMASSGRDVKARLRCVILFKGRST